jgi:hypothetical protein
LGGGGGNGRAVQVDRLKPVLKAPGVKRLKLNYDEVVTSSAFKFNLRRYIMVVVAVVVAVEVGGWTGSRYRRRGNRRGRGPGRCGASCCCWVPCGGAARAWGRAARRQGLTHVPISAQPKPFPTQDTP